MKTKKKNNNHDDYKSIYEEIEKSSIYTMIFLVLNIFLIMIFGIFIYIFHDCYDFIIKFITLIGIFMSCLNSIIFLYILYKNCKIYKLHNYIIDQKIKEITSDKDKVRDTP